MANSMPCSESLNTVVSVQECPRNKLEWEVRAKKLNCSSVSQKCVKPTDFLYHCVLNENATELIEVCASSKTIHGKTFDI